MEEHKEYKKEIQMRDIINFFLDGWKLTLLLVVVFTAFGVFTAWRAIPYYEAEAKILLGAKERGIQSVVKDMGGEAFDESSVSVEIQLLKSRNVISKTIENLGLDIQVTPHYYPIIGEPIARRSRYETKPQPALFGLNKYAWGGEKVLVDSFSVPEELRGVPFILQKNGKMSYQIKTVGGTVLGEGTIGEPLVVMVKSNVMRLTISQFTARNETQFTLVLNKVSQAVEALRSSINAFEQSKGILSVKLEHPDPYAGARILNEVIRLYMVHNFQRQTDEVGNTLLFLEEQLPALRTQVEAAEKKLNMYKYQINSIDLNRETSLTLERVEQIKSELEKIDIEQQELSRHYKETHPAVIALQQKKQQLSRQLYRAGKEVKQIPEAQQDLQNLQRDVDVNNALYLEMLNKFQQLQVVKAGQKGNVSIIDVAVPAGGPKGPERTKIVVIRFIIGLMLGLLITVVRRLWGRGVDDIEYIEHKLGLSALAMIPHSTTQDEMNKESEHSFDPEKLLAVASDDDIAIESLRSLRTNIHFNRKGDLGNVIMVVGPSPGIGKSFITANLAVSLSSSGFKVLLVDGDMRKGQLHKYFGCERSGGLSELLQSTVVTLESVHSAVLSNLSFLSTGAIPLHPSELLMTKKFSEFVNLAKKEYDYVVFDTPPILAVTDASIIGKYVDFGIFLIKHGYHSMKEIEYAKRQLDTAGIVLKGIIVNDIIYKKSGSRMQDESGYVVYQYDDKNEKHSKKAKKKRVKKERDGLHL